MSDSDELRIGVSPSELQALGFALAGVFIFVEGLQNVAAVVYAWFTRPDIELDAMSYMWERQSENIVKATVQVVAGAALVLGRERLARGWSRFRGRSEPEPPDDFEDDQHLPPSR